MDRSKLFAKVKNIQLISSKLVEGLFAGNYRSVFRGPGMEFNEVRQYGEEEDSRFIDWNVSSRMLRPYMKTFREERELTLFLILDISPSLFFGAGDDNKAEISHFVASLLTFAAVYNNDKVGSVLFTDKIEQWITPRKGKKHALRLVRDIVGAQPKGQGSDLGLAVRTVYESLTRRGICFVISDFKTATGLKELALLSRKHDVVAVMVMDPLDRSFPETGLIELQDPETYATAPSFGRAFKFRHSYTEFWSAHFREWEWNLKKRKIETIIINTSDDPVEKLLSFFRKRKP